MRCLGEKQRQKDIHEQTIEFLKELGPSIKSKKLKLPKLSFIFLVDPMLRGAKIAIGPDDVEQFKDEEFNKTLQQLVDLGNQIIDNNKYTLVKFESMCHPQEIYDLISNHINNYLLEKYIDSK